jgi:hypothetical protein
MDDDEEWYGQSGYLTYNLEHDDCDTEPEEGYECGCGYVCMDCLGMCLSDFL